MQFLILAALVLSASTQLAAQSMVGPVPAASPQNGTDHQIAKDAARVSKMDAVNAASNNSLDILAFDSREHNLRGTPFLVPVWLRGTVIPTSGAKPTVGMLKFDAAAQEVWVRRPQGDSIILASENVSGFLLQANELDNRPVERRFVRLRTGLVPGSNVAYAEVIAGGDQLNLLRLLRKTMIKEQGMPGYSVGKTTDVFRSDAQYYLQWADGTCAAVKPNKNSILGAVAARQPAVAAAAHSKTRFRTDAELGEMIVQLNDALVKK